MKEIYDLRVENRKKLKPWERGEFGMMMSRVLMDQDGPSPRPGLAQFLIYRLGLGGKTLARLIYGPS